MNEKVKKFFEKYDKLNEKLIKVQDEEKTQKHYLKLSIHFKLSPILVNWGRRLVAEKTLEKEKLLKQIENFMKKHQLLFCVNYKNLKQALSSRPTMLSLCAANYNKDAAVTDFVSILNGEADRDKTVSDFVRDGDMQLLIEDKGVMKNQVNVYLSNQKLSDDCLRFIPNKDRNIEKIFASYAPYVSETYYQNFEFVPDEEKGMLLQEREMTETSDQGFEKDNLDFYLYFSPESMIQMRDMANANGKRKTSKKKPIKELFDTIVGDVRE